MVEFRDSQLNVISEMLRGHEQRSMSPVRHYDWIAHCAAARRKSVLQSTSRVIGGSPMRSSTPGSRGSPRICATSSVSCVATASRCWR